MPRSRLPVHRSEPVIRRQVRENLVLIHFNFEVSDVLNTYVRKEIYYFFKMLLDLRPILKYG